MYCQHCGNATEFSTKKPALCCHCGVPFNSTASTAKPAPVLHRPTFLAPPRPATPVTVSNPMEVVLEGDEGFEEEPQLQSAGENPFELAPLRKAPKEKFGTLYYDKGPKMDPIDRPKMPKMSKKKFLEEFSKEGAALRPQERQHKVNGFKEGSKKDSE